MHSSNIRGRAGPRSARFGDIVGAIEATDCIACNPSSRLITEMDNPLF